MCNLYTPASNAELISQFGLQAEEGFLPYPIGPNRHGHFIRRELDSTSRMLFRGRWGLVPDSSPRLDYWLSTNNARWEDITKTKSYSPSWEKGQRCIVPVAEFWEPSYETGKCVWWNFQRIDGAAFALAGLWNDWVDKSTGIAHATFTMVTLNADGHPLMGRMHQPDPALPDDQQDKRMVVVLQPQDWDTWLNASNIEASKLVQRAPAELFLPQPDPRRLGFRTPKSPQLDLF